MTVTAELSLAMRGSLRVMLTEDKVGTMAAGTWGGGGSTLRSSCGCDSGTAGSVLDWKDGGFSVSLAFLAAGSSSDF